MHELAVRDIPLSLYVHIPWCVRKCPYCDFNSHQLPVGGIDEPDYVNALLADLEQQLPLAAGRTLLSIFIGGGTPSLLSDAAISRLLDGVRQRIDCQPDIEITLEANPGTIDQQHFPGYRAAGVNRISLGVQSFDDTLLNALGRIHDSQQACLALESIAAGGFDSYNIDLMFGLPGQDLAMAARDIERALSFSPPHLSWYQLTIEPNTPFMHRPPAGLPAHDAVADMQQEMLPLIEGHGMERYEVSAFAGQGRQCRHNLNYWQFGDYLGIGAGAHAKLSTGDGVLRFSRPRQPAEYLRAANEQRRINARRLGPADLAVEFMLNALRLRHGFSRQLFEQRTGLPISLLAAPLESATRKGLLELQSGRYRATDNGYLFLDELQMMFA